MRRIQARSFATKPVR